MMDRYTVNDAVLDVMNIYPYVSKKDLKGIIIKTIESEILPNVFLSINIPEIKSRIDLKRLELQSKRLPFNLGFNYGNELLKNIDYTEIKNIKKEILDNSQNKNKYISNNYEIKGYFDKTNSNQLLIKEFLSSYNDVIKKRNVESHAYYNPFNKKTNYFIVNLQKEIETKIYEEKLFREFIIIIEKNIRNSEYRNKLDSCKISYVADYELPDWNKVKVILNPLFKDITKNIDLWDKIQSNIRIEIENKIDTYEEKDKNLFNKYKKQLYFNMNMR